MRGSREGCRWSGPSLKNQNAIVFLSNTGLEPLENHKATEPAFNVGPLSARQGNAILMAFRCWANNGPPLVAFESSVSQNNTLSELDSL